MQRLGLDLRDCCRTRRGKRRPRISHPQVFAFSATTQNLGLYPDSWANRSRFGFSFQKPARMPVSLGGTTKAMKLPVHDLEKRFTVRKSIVQALLPISFEVGNNEFVSLLGPSGCGKTTTLYLIAGLEQPSSGEILLDDRLIRGPGADRGMVFQGYTLFPSLPVIKNTTFAPPPPRNINS